LEIPKGYYLDSLNRLGTDGQLFRSKGSAQIQIWSKDLNKKPMGNFINHRRYFSGKHSGRRFFAKQFLEPNLPILSIRESVEYQFQNLLLLKGMKCTPMPLFLTDDTVGMEYIEGETIKGLVLKHKFDNKLAECIISQIQEWGPVIVNKLRAIGRGYDCSYNNILVNKDGQITFVDFDYAGNARSVEGLIRIIKNLISESIFFAKDGYLRKH